MAILIVTAGCAGNAGPSLGLVAGTVTLDGKPLPNAEVSYCPVEGGRCSTGKTDGSGRYFLEYTYDRNGALPGEHEVSIHSENAAGEGAKDPLLSKAYNSATQLKATVKTGRNTIDFPLTSKGDLPGGL